MSLIVILLMESRIKRKQQKRLPEVLFPFARGRMICIRRRSNQRGYTVLNLVKTRSSNQLTQRHRRNIGEIWLLGYMFVKYEKKDRAKLFQRFVWEFAWKSLQCLSRKSSEDLSKLYPRFFPCGIPPWIPYRNCFKFFRSFLHNSSGDFL